MAEKTKAGVGIIGSQFVSDLHAEAFRHVHNAEVLAVASPNAEHAQGLAQRHGIPNVFTDYHDILGMPEIDIVVIGIPNYLHKQVCVDAARAGKHVICEKPLAMTLEECDEMIAECRTNGVKLMYAEELCFAPKYVRAKIMADEGALGKIYMLRQSEKHFGPHSAWFWDVKRSGGGSLLDLGCHAIAFMRWVMGKMPVKSVSATLGTYVHADKTVADDNSIAILTFEDGTVAVAEGSYDKRGGVDDKLEIYGSEGVVYADLLMGSSLLTYSEHGYSYAVEKAPTTTGWTFAMFEEVWNYGFPQEMQHFTDCVLQDKQPMVTGEDGRVVLEIIYAAYASAGQRRVIDLPFSAKVRKPIDLWKPGL
ncbi:MAG: Gfo/Idh/MocA family oxidoreductase [Chloroflexi bacterium]|nr:Gfo/Idh/MocA family oxidoreductase [Chloroflexota bacterium]